MWRIAFWITAMFFIGSDGVLASSTAAEAISEPSRLTPFGIAIAVMFVAGGLGSICRNLLEPSYSKGTALTVVVPGLVAASFVPLLLNIGKSTVLSAVLTQGDG